MKTRWSLSLLPLWISVHRRTSSHKRSSSTHRWSTFSTFTLWSLLLALCCLVVPTLSHPFPFLYQRGNRYAYARNIRPLPCVAKGGDTGVCMFAWDCMKANGTHLGTCIDRFYFGSCCKLDSKKRPIKPSHIEDIITNTISKDPSNTVTVKPSPGNKPEIDNVISKPVITETGKPGDEMINEGEITDEGMDEPDMTGTDSNDEEMNKPDMTGSVNNPEIDNEISKPVTTETGKPEDEMINEGEITDEGMDEPDMTGTDSNDKEIVKPDMTGSEITGVDMVKPNMTGTEIMNEGIVKPDLTGSEVTDDGMVKHNITEPEISIDDIIGHEFTGEGTVKPDMTEFGVAGTEISGSGLPDDGMIGIGSAGTDKKPDKEESEVFGIGIDSGTAETTELPEGYDDADNNNPIDVISEGQIPGDSAIIDDNLDAFEQNQVEVSSSSGESTDKPDETQETSTESAVFSGIKPASPISPPSTDSPFDDVDKETVLPQSFVTTFSPVNQPSKTDENKPTEVSDDDQNMLITVIPSAGKPVISDDIELTTFLPISTDKIEVDQDKIVENTESTSNDINTIVTEPSIITIKPDITTPSVSKPDVDIATELPGMPEESTVLGELDSPLVHGIPGINIIKPAEPSHSDNDGENDEEKKPAFPITVIPSSFKPTAKPEVEDDQSEKPSLPINVIPSSFIKPTAKPEVEADQSEKPALPITVIPSDFTSTAKPEVEDTTEIKKPESKPPGMTESTTDKINIEDTFTDLIIISTTTESEKPLEPIDNIPEVTIKPTIKPESPDKYDNSTDWTPIIFPGMPEKPKATEKPVEDEDMEVAASTTIANIDSLEEHEMDLLSKLNSSKYTEICGRPVYPTKRIVGGSDASFGEFPWQVSLRQWRSVTFLHKCGAALLNENWAVTAAHCVENVQPEQLLLRLGEFDLERADEPYGFVERKVQIIATHPQFDARTFEYDLALLRFYEPVNFQPNIIPICIPQDDYNFISDTGYVSGWGRLYEDGPLPSIMQKVPVPVITNPECEAMYKVAGYVEHIPQIFICAGYEAGLKDSCEGDSGGPMVIQRDGVWNLAGVISWGIGCALPNQPGVYTRISAFREWIEKIIVF